MSTQYACMLTTPVQWSYAFQILKRGAHCDDRDAYSGMTLLHFAVKAGADGIADPRPASRTIKLLLSKGR